MGLVVGYYCSGSGSGATGCARLWYLSSTSAYRDSFRGSNSGHSIYGGVSASRGRNVRYYVRCGRESRYHGYHGFLLFLHRASYCASDGGGQRIVGGGASHFTRGYRRKVRGYPLTWGYLGVVYLGRHYVYG